MTSPFSPESGAHQRGMNEQKRRDRIAAFGAIRRAAEVARKAEADAHTLATQGSHDTAAFATSEALGIRRAIRAAIGSEKES